MVPDHKPWPNIGAHERNDNDSSSNQRQPVFGRTLFVKGKGNARPQGNTGYMVPVIKLARQKRIPYSWISGYYPGLNFGRIADGMKGRKFPEIPPAAELPADFPMAA